MNMETEIVGTPVYSDEDFRRDYLDRELSFREIGIKYGMKGHDGVRQRAKRLGLTPDVRVPDEEFTKLYMDPSLMLRAVAKICGYYDGTQILKRADALGLPRNVRPKSTARPKAAKKPKEAAKVVEKKEPECPRDVAGHPRWTYAMDEVVWAARHNHVAMTVAAQALKLPITTIQQRHHQLVAASGIKVW